MSILIKGMKMPDHCWECWLMGHMICGASGELIPFSGKRNECPLVALPEKHGRLIDADKLKDKMRGKWTVYDYEAIGTMPTIVE